MRDGVRRKVTHKSSGTSPAMLWAFVGLGFLALVCVVVVILLLNQGKLGPGGLSFGLGNGKVNADSYELLRSGATLAEVEGILGGPGQTPTAADFDAICGGEEQRFTNPFFKQRGIFEENTRRGTCRVWANGSVRILLTFSAPPDAGGQLLWKILKDADGSVNSQSGNQFGPPAAPNPPPNGLPGWPNAPAVGGNITWDQLVGTWEVEGDARFRIRFGMNGNQKEMGDIFCFEGRPVKEQVYKVHDLQMENGRLSPVVEVGVVNGSPVRGPVKGSFWFENGTLHNHPGRGQMARTLRRVG